MSMQDIYTIIKDEVEQGMRKGVLVHTHGIGDACKRMSVKIVDKLKEKYNFSFPTYIDLSNVTHNRKGYPILFTHKNENSGGIFVVAETPAGIISTYSVEKDGRYISPLVAHRNDLICLPKI